MGHTLPERMPPACKHASSVLSTWIYVRFQCWPPGMRVIMPVGKMVGIPGSRWQRHNEHETKSMATLHGGHPPPSSKACHQHPSAGRPPTGPVMWCHQEAAAPPASMIYLDTTLYSRGQLISNNNFWLICSYSFWISKLFSKLDFTVILTETFPTKLLLILFFLFGESTDIMERLRRSN